MASHDVGEGYEIHILPTARNDMEEIVDYLNTLSPEVAFRYYDFIVEKVFSLSHNPLRCPLSRDKRLRADGYRVLIIKDYLVFYLVVKNTVQIHRILYGKRQYESLI